MNPVNPSNLPLSTFFKKENALSYCLNPLCPKSTTPFQTEVSSTLWRHVHLFHEERYSEETEKLHRHLPKKIPELLKINERKKYMYVFFLYLIDQCFFSPVFF